jgi:hypothetical protein
MTARSIEFGTLLRNAAAVIAALALSACLEPYAGDHAFVPRIQACQDGAHPVPVPNTEDSYRCVEGASATFSGP